MQDDTVRIDKQEVPSGDTPQEAQRSLAAVLASDLNQVAVTVASTAAAYGVKKAVDKLRKPPGPGPGADEGKGGDPGPGAG
jgi:hypothetical protein